jgi:restriction system protein
MAQNTFPMPKRQEPLPLLLMRSPWQVSALMAVFSFVGFKWVGPALCGDSENPLFRVFVAACPKLAIWVTALFVITAVGSALFSFFRNRRFDSRTDLASLNAMSWKQFEFLMADAYRRKGCEIEESLQKGADGGVDLTLRQGRHTTLVQCKRWKAGAVDVKVVRELFDIMTAEEADAGIVITTVTFTQPAREFAEGKPIELIDGKGLLELVREVQTKPMSVEENATVKDSSKDPPSCPNCGKAMVQRTAKRGSNPGQSFWGCLSYPACKGTLKM